MLLQSNPAISVNRGQPIELPVPGSPDPVLVAIRGGGAKLETLLLSSEGGTLSRVQFDYLRSAPSFHLVEATGEKVRPNLRINPLQTHAGSKVSVDFLAVPGVDAASAWRHFARGLQRVDSMNPEAWSENLLALESAQASFERLGQKRPALWVGFLRAYLLYFPLYRYEDASAGAHEVLETLGDLQNGQAIDEDFATIEVLAHQLAGQILLESEARGRDAAGKPPLEAARDHFAQARNLAAAAGLLFEEAWAVNNLGIAFFYEDRLDLALDHYAHALQRAQALRDSFLIALVGSNIAVAQERQGHIDDAVQTLERLEQEPTLQDSAMEHEHLLSLLGTYYLKLYRFPEALQALNEALHWSNQLDSSENRGRNLVMLGRAYRELGQPEKGLNLAKMAVPNLEAVGDTRGLRQAHRLLADFHRVLGAFDDMVQERQLEWEAQPPETELDLADWWFSRAEDALARGDAPTAAKRFIDSAKGYQVAGMNTRADIGILHACAAASEELPPGECSIERLQSLHHSVESVQASTPALGARFAWVRLLAAQGQRDLALRTVELLIDDIRFYRQTLPGVLGAWYWDARETVLNFYLQLMLDRAGEYSGQPADVLLALDRLRNSGSLAYPAKHLDAVENPTVDGSPKTGAPIRTLLARRDRAASAVELTKVQALIDRELTRRQPASQAGKGTDMAGLMAEMERLPHNWSLLAYYLAGPTAMAWVGDNKILERIDLGPSAPIRERIERVRA
ncbi:MAG: tetratricopeptide repeat protein, partial [Gammaproteobacteria bacterium]|nr:tetratricopeptide repeat protein [Gammaproteobacteria bacterium]